MTGSRWLGAWTLILTLGTASCGAPITARQARDVTSNTAAPAASEWSDQNSDDMIALARSAASLPEERRTVVEIALAMAGARAQKFDCSSFAQHVYAASNTSIPRTTRAQFAQGRPVQTNELRAGDLVFFCFSHRPVDHVGIYAGNGAFVHVSSSTRMVRLESLSQAVFANSVVAGCSFLDP